AELKEGRIIGVRCHHCRRTVVPPRIFCEWCFRPMDEWVYLEDHGVVNTFSICYVRWDMERLEEPLIPAVIEIAGASKGMGILHLLGEVDPQKVKIGMKVKAVWKPAAERIGAITDILYFKPME
ncbi:MAG: Zn-ribbon domain-containing OB-fold protein, partial [Anaerolineae bacterium]